jgi:gliding motility-associated protein GldM
MMTEGNAKLLKDRLEKYRDKILSFVDEKDRGDMMKTVGLDVHAKYTNANGAPETWESHYFEGVIFAACITLLNKTVGEVRNAESGVLKYVLRSITQDDFKFSNVQAKVIPTSQLVFLGEPYKAEVIVAAYDDKQPIVAYWRSGTGALTSTQGANVVKGDDGIAKLTIGTHSVGDFSFTGFIQMVGPDGVPQTHPFSDKYTVMAASATAAAEKMNVLYAGIENPVSVSASVAPEKISISLSGGTSVTTGPGKYNVTVPESLVGKTVTISIFANIDGKQQSMGSTVFRIKRVPDPVAKLGNKITTGRFSKQEILANPFIFANLGEDFVYDLKWTVNSFTVIFEIKGIDDPPMTSSNNQFTEAMKTKLNNSAPGTVIYFSDIKATSVAGTRTLNNIHIKLK